MEREGLNRIMFSVCAKELNHCRLHLRLQTLQNSEPQRSMGVSRGVPISPFPIANLTPPDPACGNISVPVEFTPALAHSTSQERHGGKLHPEALCTRLEAFCFVHVHVHTRALDEDMCGELDIPGVRGRRPKERHNNSPSMETCMYMEI